MLKNSIVFILLFSLQCYLLFQGHVLFGKIINPFLFFGVSILIPIYYFIEIKKQPSILEIKSSKSTFNIQALWYALASFIFVIISFEEVRKELIRFPMPTPNSDVMTQLSVMYDRVTHGIFPYSPVMEMGHHPYPVYMPMHFLPIGISKLFQVDIRWCGFYIFAISASIIGYYIGTKKIHIAFKILLCSLPSVALWMFILFGSDDIFITLEVLIAGYYLLLITGLLMRNNLITFISICLCLLSRYTFIFWLPLFGLLFLVNNSFKKSVLFLVGIIGVLFFTYILPFYLKDTSILSTGVTYHNNCAVGEWSMGFWTAEQGIHFAYLIKQITKGTDEHGVYINRIIQAISLIICMITGLYFYFKNKINYQKYVAGYLYIFMLVFYCFSPLTYRYYLIVLLTLSIALGIEIMSSKSNLKFDNSVI